MYVITETIHHGEYHNVRTFRTDGGTIDLAAFEAWGMASPYAWRSSDVAERVAADLAATGEAAHGWARYTLTKSDEQAGRAAVLEAWHAIGEQHPDDIADEEDRERFWNVVERHGVADPYAIILDAINEEDEEEAARPRVISITRADGVAGQYALEVATEHAGEVTLVSFVGSTYGAPVVMVWNGGQVPVVDWKRFGDTLDEEWVRRFYA